MSYQVLARKYRPQILSELVGQDILVQTLLSAIKNNKVPHAFILSGIRGIGKTTTARIIAKALNCIGINGNVNQITNPCGKCSSCLSIENSNHQDVIEMDAASRTGVDDIREIIDNISYATSIGRFRVYIIDEVHMLSNNAFNALLKTLEEPPAHIKFIFATTEIKKIPVTIISRCQRFDLRRLNNEEIVGHLKDVLKNESFESEEDALNIIANFSEGSVRDSLSILDQALSFNNYEKLLTQQKVEEMIGIVDKIKIINFFEKILAGEINEVLKMFTGFYQNNSDIISIANDLLDISYKVSLIKLEPTYRFIDISEVCQEKIKAISEKISIPILARMWQMILKGITELKISPNQKMSFEMILIRICHMSDIADFNEILKNKNIINDVTNTDFNSKSSESNLTSEIIRNFPQTKIIDNLNKTNSNL